MKAHVILLIGEQRGGERGRERKERPSACLWCRAFICWIILPFYKHLIPSHRQARAPVILLYIEELREVARRQSKATAYYITTDKIERPRTAETEKEREQGTQWKVFCCGVIRLSCCWLQSGTTESPKCRWLLTGLASCVCVCCNMCVCVLKARHSKLWGKAKRKRWPNMARWQSSQNPTLQHHGPCGR